MAAVGNTLAYSLQELLHLGRQDAVLLDHNWLRAFLLLSPLRSTADLMTELWVNVARQVGFFLTDAGARFWVKAVTVGPKSNVILEGIKKMLLLALNLLK